VVKIAQPHICPIRLVRSIFEKVQRTHLACSRHLCRIVPLSKVFFANEAEFETNMKALIAETFNLPLPVQPAPAAEESSAPLTAEGEEGERTEIQPLKKMKQDEESAVPLPNPEEESQLASLNTDSGVEEAAAAASGKRSITEMQSVVAPLLPVSILFKKRNHNTLNRLHMQHVIFGNMPRSRCTVDFKNPKVPYPYPSPPGAAPALLAVSQLYRMVAIQIRGATRIEGVKHPIDLTLSRQPHLQFLTGTTRG
jgi:hypothetical protein